MSNRKLTVLLTILAGVLFLHGWYMSSEPELIAAREAANQLVIERE